MITFNSRSFANLISVTLPDLGEGTKEATIKEWYVTPGSRVEEVSKGKHLLCVSINLFRQQLLDMITNDLSFCNYFDKPLFIKPFFSTMIW